MNTLGRLLVSRFTALGVRVVAVDTDASNGTLTLNADGTFSYTHDGSENLTDSFTYAVSDSESHTAQATVTFTMNPVNDNNPVADAEPAVSRRGSPPDTGTIHRSDCFVFAARSTSVTTTRHPALASPAAMAAPMPREPPVTTAILPVRRPVASVIAA